jgi:hypothetical protein
MFLIFYLIMTYKAYSFIYIFVFIATCFYSQRSHTTFRNDVSKKKNWCFKIITKFREFNLELYTDIENILHKNVITQLEYFVFDKYKVNWQNIMFSQKVGNKLRTYKLFKEVFETEMYLSKNYKLIIIR